MQVGTYSGILQGIFYDRFGVISECIISTTLIFSGFLGAYITSTSSASPFSFAVCFYLIGQGSHGFYTLSTMTNVPNFPRNYQGTVMGILAAAFGISAAVFAALESALDPPLAVSHTTCAAAGANVSNTATARDPEPMNFFLMCAFTTLAVGAVAALLQRRVPLAQAWLPVATSSDPATPRRADAAEHAGDMPLTDIDARGNSSPGHAETAAAGPRVWDGARGRTYVRVSGGDDDGDQKSLLSETDLDAAAATAHGSPGGAASGGDGAVCDGAAGGAAGSGAVLDVHGWALLRSYRFWFLFLALAVDDGYVDISFVFSDLYFQILFIYLLFF